MIEQTHTPWLLISGGNLKPDFVKEVIAAMPSCHILAIDGALCTVDRLGIRPEVVLGDFDTVDEMLLARYRADEKIIFETHNPVKDATDTELAIEYAISHGAEKITILGALGGRMDHALANIQVLLLGLQANVPCEILDEQNRIMLLNRAHVFEKNQCFGKYLSFIPLTERVDNVTLTGFRYPLCNHTLTIGSSLGISNELVEESAEISFTGGILICIESRDK